MQGGPSPVINHRCHDLIYGPASLAFLFKEAFPDTPACRDAPLPRCPHATSTLPPARSTPGATGGSPTLTSTLGCHLGSPMPHKATKCRDRMGWGGHSGAQPLPPRSAQLGSTGTPWGSTTNNPRPQMRGGEGQAPPGTPPFRAFPNPTEHKAATEGVGVRAGGHPGPRLGLWGHTGC